MTTILCDVKLGMMIADSSQSHGNLRSRSPKIFRIGETIASWSSRADAGERWALWLREDSGAVAWRGENRPPPSEVPELEGLWLRPDGLYLYQDLCVPIQIHEPIYGIGSGRDFGLGALAAGRPLVNAMQIAARLDLYTAPPFTLMSLDGKDAIYHE